MKMRGGFDASSRHIYGVGNHFLIGGDRPLPCTHMAGIMSDQIATFPDNALALAPISRQHLAGNCA
jgi:hypothetical protein